MLNALFCNTTSVNVPLEIPSFPGVCFHKQYVFFEHDVTAALLPEIKKCCVVFSLA